MSETTKKSLILNALAQPGGSDLSNAEIAKAVGCFSNLVKSVRAEVESDRLRAENENLLLRAELAEIKADILHQENCGLKDRLDSAMDRLATQQEAVTAPAVKPVHRKSRRVKAEFYPLFGES